MTPSATEPLPRRMRPTVHLAASGFVTTAVGAVANFAFLVLLIKRLGGESTGVIVVAVAAQVLLLRLSDLGSMGAIVRYLSADFFGKNEGSARSAVRILRIGLVPAVSASLIATALLWVAAPTLAPVLAPDSSSEMSQSLRAVAVGAPIFVTYMNVVHSLKGLEGFGSFRLIERIGRPCAYLLIGVSVGASSRPAVVVMLMQAVNTVLLVAAAVALFRLLRPFRNGLAPKTVNQSDFWRFALPQGGAGVLDGVLAWSDTILVSIILSPAAAAVYTAISRVILVHAFSADAVTEVGAPRFSAAATRQDAAGISETYSQLRSFQVRIVWPVAILLFPFLPELFKLVDSTLDEGVGAARFILVGSVLASAMGPGNVLQRMLGRSDLVLLASACALGVNLALNAVLLDWWGITGAGFSWAAALVTSSTISAVLTRRHHDLSAASWLREAPPQLLFPVACAAALWIVTLPGGRTVGAVLAACIGALLGMRAVLASRHK